MRLKTFTYQEALDLWKGVLLSRQVPEGIEKEEYLVDLGHEKKSVKLRRMSRLKKLHRKALRQCQN